MNMYGEGRVTKAEIEDYIATLCGVPVFNLCFTRLEDNPGVFKHCCVYIYRICRCACIYIKWWYVRINFI